MSCVQENHECMLIHVAIACPQLPGRIYSIQTGDVTITIIACAFGIF